MAEHCAPGTPLIAETGGLNAMIVDSTALPEHAVRDIVNGSFRSAGQRCSALRCLYVQEDISEKLIKMLKGAMNELVVSDPWLLSTDVGPVIDAAAHKTIADHITQAEAEGRLIHTLQSPSTGTFISPAVIRVNGIADMTREIFGPVLTSIPFRTEEEALEMANDIDYGLTGYVWTNDLTRALRFTEALEAGMIWVNSENVRHLPTPFGGVKASGIGRDGGDWSFEFYMEQKHIGFATGQHKITKLGAL